LQQVQQVFHFLMLTWIQMEHSLAAMEWILQLLALLPCLQKFYRKRTSFLLLIVLLVYNLTGCSLISIQFVSMSKVIDW
jgi:hypothetical protein